VVQLSVSVAERKQTHLVAPDRSKYVVQLDVDGRERQEASHQHLGEGCTVPGEGGDLARELGGPVCIYERECVCLCACVRVVCICMCA